MIDKKLVMIIGIVLLLAGASYAARIVLFGVNSDGTVVTFTSGSQNWTVPQGVTSVEVLVVAGGGGGGGNCNSCGGAGAGGAGGLLYNSSYPVTPDATISVVVGAGGAGGPAGYYGSGYKGVNGGNSSFGNLIAIGGGGGHSQNGLPGSNGGSGGGGSGGGSPPPGGAGNGTLGQGNNGGSGIIFPYGGGGGGGAGSAGSNGYNTGNSNGGVGLAYSITGSSVYYAGGGGGGAYSSNPAGVGGLGGGGNGVNSNTNNGNGFSGTPNTGGGGGGANGAPKGGAGGAGGSGIVIIKYKPTVQISSSQTGLVGHWALNSEDYNSATGRVTDKSAYENHGTNYGANFTTDRMGHSNGAMFFDGSANDYILITDKDSLDLTTDFTISTWINPKTQSSGYNSIVNKGNWRYYLGLYNDNRLDLWINNAISATAASGLSPNIWYHIVWVHSSSSGDYDIVYVNGDNSSSLSINGNLPNPSADATNLGIGARNIGNYAFNGSIADVRIYNRALSSEEIIALNNSYNPKLSSGSLQKGLVFDMPLTSSATKSSTVGSEIMTDKTPYANDGQNSGASVGSEYSSFDGVNDYVNVTASTSYEVQNISIGFWINPSVQDNAIITLMDKDHSTIPNYQGWVIQSEDATTNKYYYFAYYNGSNFEVAGNYGAGKGVQLIQGTWQYLTYTKSGKTLTGYINGVVVWGPFNASNSTIVYNSSRRLSIGHAIYSAINNRNFNGSIAGVKIYNRALSTEEIQLLYDKGRKYEI
jgi:hypothetical protein